ncbi:MULTISPECIES: transposase, partial [unclassified Marinobacter]|uniref:transposase n=1 Tax=unclassified Marinobacter TaxID=83889 RepID=UPI0018F1952B
MAYPSSVGCDLGGDQPTGYAILSACFHTPEITITPEMVIPDNLRSGVSKACRYDPDLNPSYQQLAAHYQVAVLPARPYKP